MVEEELTEEQKAARDRVHALLSELSEYIGPSAPWPEDTERADPGTWQISEWVIVANWTRMEDGDNFLTRFGSENLLAHHRTGLLYVGLYDFD